jgi:hypothetical protein
MSEAVATGLDQRTAPVDRRSWDAPPKRADEAENAMIDVDTAFNQATENLIALYRSVERRSLDLPLISVTPALVFTWAVMRFYFFFVIGLFLIIPTNLVVLIRNLFPGRWRYRPFFLRHLYYAWLWVWRGEAPTAPCIFVRPLLSFFMKSHFEGRLRRLRSEILLHEHLSEPKRSELLCRLDRALERWKVPRFKTLFFTAWLPGLFSLPGWYGQFTEFAQSLEIRVPSVELSETSVFILVVSFFYLLVFPVTAFMAKRGLFIGRDPRNICFPGAQEGAGAYLEEEEILRRVGVRSHETPVDLLILAGSAVLGSIFSLLTFNQWIEMIPAGENDLPPSDFLPIQAILSVLLSIGLMLLAWRRRKHAGRY